MRLKYQFVQDLHQMVPVRTMSQHTMPPASERRTATAHIVGEMVTGKLRKKGREGGKEGGREGGEREGGREREGGGGRATCWLMFDCHQGVEDVKNAVNVPHFVVLS